MEPDQITSGKRCLLPVIIDKKEYGVALISETGERIEIKPDTVETLIPYEALDDAQVGEVWVKLPVHGFRKDPEGVIVNAHGRYFSAPRTHTRFD